MFEDTPRSTILRPPLAMAVAAALGLAPAHALALGGPSPGAVTAQTAKLPPSPGSVRGLADNAAVSGFTGQVQYAIPIELPAAPGGLTPALSLGYDGGLGNGPLGVGWGLAQPEIRRSLRLGVPGYAAGDELEVVGLGVDGQLVALAGGEYRIEGQGNRYVGRAVAGGFELTGPDGRVYRFGATAPGRKASGARVAAWYLEEVRDVAGQVIAYQYHQDRGEVFLDAITWGPAVAGAPAFRAELIYEARADAVVSYRAGFRVEAAQRLAQLKIWSFGQVRRVVGLRYDASFALSRLAGVTVTSADGADALPPVTLRYAAAEPGAVSQVADVAGWALNQQGTSLFDVDDDGAMDLLRLQPTGHSYRRNLGGRFDVARPVAGAPGASLDQVRLLDLTGDSGAELVWQQGSQWSVYQLTGADPASRSWASLGTWTGAQNLSLSGVAVADWNGDYLMDVATVSGSSIQLRFGTVAGLAAPVLRGAIDPARTFIAPGNASTSFPDINGDGLADAVYLGATAMNLYLGRGDGTFERYRDVTYPWTGAVTTAQLRLGDLNRDGLLDVAVVRAGNVEWYRGLANGALDPGPVRIARPAGTDASVVVALADANGNGSEDLVWSSDAGMWILDLAGPSSAGMLTAIDNGLGQTQAFGYDGSSRLALAAAAAGAPWATSLPVSIPVAVTTRLTLASGEPSRSTRLDVRDGVYDRGERRFVGFGASTTTRPDPADGAPPAQLVRTTRQYAPALGLDRVLRGQVVLERISDGSGAVLRETTTTAAALTVAGLPVAEPRLRRAGVLQVVVRRLEGAATPVVLRTRYQHDAEARVIEEDADGRVDLTGDEVVRTRAYAAADPVTGVRDLICEEGVVGADGVAVTRTRKLYGDATQVLALCQAGKGWLREEQGYLASEDRWVAQRRKRYDARGNEIESTERGVTRQIGYDAFGQFPILETVSPEPGRQLVWRVDWDTRLGVPRQLTGPDGAVTTAGYDGVGRVVSLADGAGPPHTYHRYAWTAPWPRTETFTFDGAPEALAALPASWAPGAGWRHRVAITSSAGEPLLDATQLDGARWIVSGRRTRDALGRTTAVAAAYYADGADPAALAPPAATGVQTVSYDALDRPVLQTSATGTRKQLAYTPLGVTVSADGLAPVTAELDGLGRTVRASRAVAGVVEAVATTYDAAGRVVRYQVQGGQVEHAFTYDTLGRLVRAEDPDVGVRTMTYDDSGALIRGVNGAGEPIDYTYDGAGRLASERADGVTVRFHYDQPRAAGYLYTAGRLAWVEDATGSVDLGYDSRGADAVFHRQVVDGAVVVEATRRTQRAPSGLVRAIAFDDGLEVALGHDAAGRVIRAGDDWTVVDQGAAGDVLTEQFGNGLVQRYERDAMRMPTRIRVERGAQALYDVAITRGPSGLIDAVADQDGAGLDHTASYGYDAAGRLTAATLGAAGPGQYQFAFAYDGLQNLVRRDVSGPTQLGVLAGAYRYAGAGPRQLSAVADPVTGASRASFAYDAAGRQVQHAGKALHYNARSQLIRVDGLAGGAGSVEHRYGYDGERVITRDVQGVTSYFLGPDVIERAGVREHYVRVGDRTLLRATLDPAPAGSAAVGWVTGGLRGAGLALGAWLVLGLARARRQRPRARPAWSVRAAYLGLAALVLPACGSASTGQLAAAATWQTARKLYFHAGATAGPALITDAAGLVFEERRQEPFGGAVDAYRDGVGVTAVDYRREPTNALNKLTDPDSELSFHGARWLPSDTAQWLTPDPPVAAPDPRFALAAWALNPYQYVEQNPVAYWDPDGRDKVGVIEANGPVGPHESPYEGTVNLLHVAWEITKFIYEGFKHNSELQERAFDALEVRAYNQYIYPVLQAELKAARLRGSIPTGDDIQAWPMSGGEDLFESTRRGIAEALRVPNQGVIDSNIRMLQTKLRQYYNDEDRYYTVGPHGEKYKVPWERFPRPGDYAERRNPDGRLEGYGPQAFCTSTLEQATCTVR